MLGTFLLLGLSAGSLFAFVATGLSVVRRSSRFVDFSLGALVALGAYGALITTRLVGGHGFTSAALAFGTSISLTSVFGFLLHRYAYRRLLQRGTGSLGVMVASLAIMIIIENVLSLVFGDNTLRLPIDRTLRMIIPGASMSTGQLLSLAGVFILIVGMAVWNRTAWGRLLIAVDNDPELAKARGIDVWQVRLLAGTLAGGGAGVAGFLWAWENDLSPHMGFRPLLYGLVGATIAGFDTSWGAGIGALMVGVLSYVAVVWLPTQWQDAVALVVLVGALALRPRGIVRVGATRQQ